MNKQVIMLIMVIALVGLVGVQAIQISDLKSDISDGSLNVNAVAGTPARSAPPVQQAAPTMVGGC